MSNIDVFLQGFLLISSWQTLSLLGVFLLLLLFIKILENRGTAFGTAILIAMALGLSLGLLLQFLSGFSNQPSEITFIKETTAWLGLLGNGYMALIRMLVVPLVIISILHVFINLDRSVKVGKLLRLAIGVTMTMVTISAIVGLSVGLLFQVGSDATLINQAAKIKDISSLPSTLLKLIPANPVQAMVDANVIALVIFSGFIAIGVNYAAKVNKEIVQPFIDLVNALHSLLIQVTLFVITLMPYAIIPLLANTIALRGLESIKEVGVFIVALYIAIAIMFLLQLLLLLFVGANPLMYLKKSSHVLALAFTSRSSMGTLPATIEALTKTMGVHPSTANFVASFGTTAGMQGCAGVFPALLIVYVCNVSQIPIDLTMIIMSIIVITLGSLGIAGIPGTATMAASVSLSGTGLGAYYPKIGPILAVDPLIDMGRTFLNVSGSMVNAIVVDHLLNQHDKSAFHDSALKTK